VYQGSARPVDLRGHAGVASRQRSANPC
jgi:hypothetical protein